MIQEFATISKQLSQELEIPLVDSLDCLTEQNAIFDTFENIASNNIQQLTLHLLLENKPSLLKFDLAQGEVALRANKVSKSNEVIAKAIGCKSHYRPNVLDATAGMGRDSLMMAMLGCNVIMQERNFAIYHLLNNALLRLKNSGEFKAEIVERLSLQNQNSIDKMANLNNVDVIYLDPMFPNRKKSALVKKEMRLFKLIAGEDEDADQLLLSSLSSGAKRVVVKRPKGAPVLCHDLSAHDLANHSSKIKPSHEIVAKKFRYDIYLN
jgi:16S rRNA (guanine1516-N2)-methyltransferase